MLRLALATSLPLRHQRWVDQLIGTQLDLPREVGVRCEACAFLPPKGVELQPEEHYSRATKCCTFLPQLPNFLYGALLAEQPERFEPGADQLRTPMGLLARPGYQARYREMVSAGSFGLEVGMRCPYYEPEAGACGVWAFREAQCSTWFCNHEHGAHGRELWVAVRAWLGGVEAALTLWCVRERGVAVAEAGREDADAWGHWWGREREYYEDCAAAVDGLDVAGLRAVLPPSSFAMQETVLQARAALERPESLFKLLR